MPIYQQWLFEQRNIISEIIECDIVSKVNSLVIERQWGWEGENERKKKRETDTRKEKRKSDKSLRQRAVI
jgi:hypothetical protein